MISNRPGMIMVAVTGIHQNDIENEKTTKDHVTLVHAIIQQSSFFFLKSL
ncbi:MAG: hypothetical protein M0Q91_09110 [Methanoregula sp.]|jgi:hypothetical protein|nr:hypothetical protein [Methanoregula sp.]